MSYHCQFYIYLHRDRLPSGGSGDFSDWALRNRLLRAILSQAMISHTEVTE